jgi:hypothetical protein
VQDFIPAVLTYRHSVTNRYIKSTSRYTNKKYKRNKMHKIGKKGTNTEIE